MGNLEEIWKDIPGYEGLYQISKKDGSVKSYNKVTAQNHFLKGKTLKPALANGSLVLGLSKNREKKTCSLRRLYVKTFIDNTLNKGSIVTLKDNNPRNINIENIVVVPRDQWYKALVTKATKGVLMRVTVA